MSICHWAGSQKLLPWSPRCSQGDLKVDVKDNQCRKRDQRREHTPINSLEGLNTFYKYFPWYTAILIFFSSHIFPVEGKKVHDFLNILLYLESDLGKYLLWRYRTLQIFFLPKFMWQPQVQDGWNTIYMNSKPSGKQKNDPKRMLQHFSLRELHSWGDVCHSFDNKPCYSTWVLRILPRNTVLTARSMITHIYHIFLDVIKWDLQL